MKILEDKEERKEDKAADPSTSKTVEPELKPLKVPTIVEKQKADKQAKNIIGDIDKRIANIGKN